MDDTLNHWSEVADRLAALPRGTAFQLAKHIDMNSSLLYRKLNSRKGDLKASQARAIGEFLSQAESGGHLTPGVTEPERPFIGRPAQISLPVYGYAAASDGDRFAMNEGQILEWLALPHGIELGNGEFFVVRPLGTSMEPRIFAGEPQVARKDYPPARGQDCVVEFGDGSGLIKTFEGRRDGRLFVKQWNEEKVLDFPATSVKAVHAVIIKL